MTIEILMKSPFVAEIRGLVRVRGYVDERNEDASIHRHVRGIYTFMFIRAINDELALVGLSRQEIVL